MSEDKKNIKIEDAEAEAEAKAADEAEEQAEEALLHGLGQAVDTGLFSLRISCTAYR